MSIDQQTLVSDYHMLLGAGLEFGSEEPDVGCILSYETARYAYVYCAVILNASTV